MSGEELPPGWASARLNAVAAADAPICYGVVQPGDEDEGEVPLIRVCDLREGTVAVGELRRVAASVDREYARSRVRSGDVLVSVVGTIGRIAVVPPAADGSNIARAVARVRPGDTVSSGWLNAVLNAASLQESLHREAREVARKTLNIGTLEQVEIPVPPLNEQRRIVAKLEDLLARSRRAKDALEAIPPLLEKLRQSILAAAFRGDLTADWRAKNPDVEPAEELLKRIRVERRKKWEEAELAKLRAKGKLPTDDRWKAKYQQPELVDTDGLPELPDGWSWASWQEVGFSQNGRAFPSAEYRDTGVPLLRPGNLHVSGEVEWTGSNTRCLDQQWAEEYPEHVVRRNELVINLTAQSLKDEFLGRVCMTGENDCCLLNQRIGRLTPVLLEPRFVFWLFKSPEFRAFVDGLNSGSLIQHMFTSQIDEFAVRVPPISEQHEIAKRLDQAASFWSGAQSTLNSVGTQLGSLDVAALAKAFRGELVEQDPNDEPASVMLERLAAERGAAEHTQPTRKCGSKAR